MAAAMGGPRPAGRARDQAPRAKVPAVGKNPPKQARRLSKRAPHLGEFWDNAARGRVKLITFGDA
jgi:hypothetical protein